jgi:hypothetical protein
MNDRANWLSRLHERLRHSRFPRGGQRRSFHTLDHCVSEPRKSMGRRDISACDTGRERRRRSRSLAEILRRSRSTVHDPARRDIADVDRTTIDRRIDEVGRTAPRTRPAKRAKSGGGGAQTQRSTRSVRSVFHRSRAAKRCFTGVRSDVDRLDNNDLPKPRRAYERREATSTTCSQVTRDARYFLPGKRRFTVRGPMMTFCRRAWPASGP